MAFSGVVRRQLTAALGEVEVLRQIEQCRKKYLQNISSSVRSGMGAHNFRCINICSFCDTYIYIYRNEHINQGKENLFRLCICILYFVKIFLVPYSGISTDKVKNLYYTNFMFAYNNKIKLLEFQF